MQNYYFSDNVNITAYLFLSKIQFTDKVFDKEFGGYYAIDGIPSFQCPNDLDNYYQSKAMEEICQGYKYVGIQDFPTQLAQGIPRYTDSIKKT